MNPEPKGFWGRSATKAAIALTAFAWLPLLTKWGTLQSASTHDIEYAIRATMEAWLAALGIVRFGTPSMPMPPPPEQPK